MVIKTMECSCMVNSTILLIILLNAVACDSKRLSPSPHHAPQRNKHDNISLLLDNLMRGYDNSVRPDFGGRSNRQFVYKSFYPPIYIILFF